MAKLDKFGMKLTANQLYLVQNTSIIFIGLFVNQFLQTLGSVILAHAIPDQVKFGQVNLMLQIFGMTSLFLNLGLNSALIYSFSKDPIQAISTNYRLSFYGSIVVAVIIAALLTVLAPILAAVYHMPELAGGLVISSVMLVFNTMINTGVAAFSGSRDFSVQAFFMVLTTLFSTIGTVLGVLLNAGHLPLLWNVSLYMGIGAFATAAIISWKVRQAHHPLLSGKFDWAAFRELLRYGSPVWAGNIAKAFQQPFLVMMIGASSVAAVGYLTNGLRIVGFLNIITWSFMIVTLPFIAEQSENLEECRSRGTLCFRYNNLILYPITLLVCLFPNQITSALFGAKYTTGDSGTYIRILSLGVFFSAVSRLGGPILAGIGKTRANFWVMIVSGIPVVGIVPWVAAQDPLYAVWAYAGGWALSAGSMIWFLLRDGMPLNWVRAFGQPLIPTLVMAILMEAGIQVRALQTLFIWLALFSVIGITWLLERRSNRTQFSRGLSV